MLSFFSAPKFCSGDTRIIQFNAIRSWAKIYPQCEIIIFSKDGSSDELINELNLRVVRNFECNKYGTPIVNDLFHQAQKIASNDILCYVNSDIILLNDFITSVIRIQNLENFLVIGRRWDVNVSYYINFNSHYESEIKNTVKRNGKLHSPSGIDYFIFKRRTIEKMPHFAVGRPGWDNWLICHCRSKKFKIIDATSQIMAIHQNHDYSHIQKINNDKIDDWSGPEANHHYDLMKNQYYLCDIFNSNLVLTKNFLLPAIMPKYMIKNTITYLLHINILYKLIIYLKNNFNL